MFFYFMLFSGFLTSLFAKETRDMFHVDPQYLLSVSKKHWEKLEDKKQKEVDRKIIKTLPLRQPEHVPIRLLIPGQKEISAENCLDKLRENRKDWNLEWDEDKKIWKRKYNNGKSLIPRKEALFAVKSKYGLLLVDGHHHVIMSLYTHAETVPIFIMEDFSDLSKVDLWRKLKERGLVYLKESPEDLAQNFPNFHDMKDNPNRYLASLLALKIKVEYNAKKDFWEVVKSNQRKRAIWIKINNGLPFVEFYLADLISKNQIFYDKKWGKDIPKGLIEEIRQIVLQDFADQPDSILQKIPLIQTLEEAKFLTENEGVLQKKIARFLKGDASTCSTLF